MLRISRLAAVAIAGLVMWSTPEVIAAERDLYSGLAYLRAGDLRRAEESLTRYRNEERDLDIRRSVDETLPLLREPLSGEMREYIARNLEERTGIARSVEKVRTRPYYWSRMFPVFP